MRRASTTYKPIKMWIDGKCFEIRRFPKKRQETKQNKDVQKPSEVDYEICTNIDGKLYTSFRLPEIYYAKLLNFPDWDVKLLESHTDTLISIPKKGPIVIIGDNQANITEARDEIHSVIGSIRDSVRALQFISIPMTSSEIIANFTKFKREILEGQKIEGMEESIFQSPLKLHLTVVVFALMDKHEEKEAIKALQDYKSSILDPLIEKNGPIKIRAEGVDCMEKNIEKANVLYAKAKIVDENEHLSLQKVVDDLSNHFNDRGLVRTYKDNVKLHMTLINTKYRKVTDSPSRKRWVKRQSFNATNILKKYKDFIFGECYLATVHLSLMGNIGEDGFYKPMAMVNIDM